MIRAQLCLAIGIISLVTGYAHAESLDSKARFTAAGSISRAAFNDNDSRLITWDTKRKVTSINVIDTGNGSTIKTFDLEKGSTLWKAAIDPLGEYLAIVSDLQGKSHLDLYSVQNMQRVFRASDLFDATTGALKFSADSKNLIVSFRSAATESSIGVWDCASGKSLWKAVYQVGSSGAPKTIRVSPDNQWVLATNENFFDDVPAIVWNLKNGQEHCRVEKNCAPAAAFSADSKLVAIADKKLLTRIINLHSKTEIYFEYKADRVVRDVAFSRDSTALAVVWHNDIDQVFESSWYDLKTQKHNNRFTFANASWISPMNTPALAVCVGFNTGPKEVWNLETGKSIFKASVNDQPLALSPAGSLLLTGQNGKVSVFETPTK